MGRKISKHDHFYGRDSQSFILLLVLPQDKCHHQTWNVVKNIFYFNEDLARDLRHSLHSDHQNLLGLTPILADMTHSFVWNAVNREQRDTYQERGSVPASTDQASQTRVGGERSHRRAVRVGYAGEYDGGGRRDAVSGCLVPGSAGDDDLHGGFGGWDWGRQRQQRVGGGVRARAPPMGCAAEVSCLASDRGEGH